MDGMQILKILIRAKRGERPLCPNCETGHMIYYFEGGENYRCDHCDYYFHKTYFLGEFEEMSPGLGFPSVKDSLEPEPIQNKDEIVTYMKNGSEQKMTTTGLFNDLITGKTVAVKRFYDDGVFSWTSSVIYHVEKYNLRLPEVYYEHVEVRQRGQ